MFIWSRKTSFENLLRKIIEDGKFLRSKSGNVWKKEDSGKKKWLSGKKRKTQPQNTEEKFSNLAIFPANCSSGSVE